MQNQSIFYRRNKMNEDLYLRDETKKLIEKFDYHRTSASFNNRAGIAGVSIRHSAANLGINYLIESTE